MIFKITLLVTSANKKHPAKQGILKYNYRLSISSYYLGYNYAKSIIITNGDAISEEMLKNILVLKHELGFDDTSF